MLRAANRTEPQQTQAIVVQRLDHARDRPRGRDEGSQRQAQPAGRRPARRAQLPRQTASRGPRRRRRVLRHPDCPPSADHDDARRIIDGQIADGATDIGDDPQVGIDGLRRDRQNGKRAPVTNVLRTDDKRPPA
jgi:hypothetical protein